MLDLMRRKKRLKIILWLVIFSLALGMLLFFVPGVNIGNVATDTSAASVDGQTISINEFASTYRRVVKQYSNRGKNRIDPETLKNMGLPRQVLDELITEKVIQTAAKRFGITVTENEVRRAIETYPYFQDQGKFIGVERYKELLATNDIPVEEFERDMRHSQLLKKLRAIITDSLNVSESDLRDEFARANQQTQVYFAVLKKEDFKKRVNPNETELRAYFEEHKASYQVKEKRRAQYLEIPLSAILADANVVATDQEIQDAWNQKSHEDAVEASHILLRVEDESKDAEVKAKAETILKKAKSGGDFAELARKNSQDTGSASQGGYLGSFQRGQMVREFEDAAFALKPGEISDLVRTQYGYHIIQVLKHETPTLESSLGALMAEVRMKKSQELARQKAEEAAQLAVKNGDLNSAAKTLGFAADIKDSGYLQKGEASAGGNNLQALEDEVFRMKEINSIGSVVELPMGFAIPKLIEVQQARPGNFSEFRSQIETDFIDSKAKELLQAEARKLSEEARKQSSLEKAAKQMGWNVKTSQLFNMSGTPDPEIGSNPSFNSAAFELEPGAVSDPLSLLDDQAVLQVKSRTPFDEAAFQKERAQLKAKLLQASQDLYFQDYVRKITSDLEKAGKIRINPKTLEDLPSSYY
ncbi:MAG: peptidylprolyl isomerase [Acidobacteria bacterium]|nr:peptidylprolyl isomerase [Acidobacteriota bacterium]